MHCCFPHHLARGFDDIHFAEILGNGSLDNGDLGICHGRVLVVSSVEMGGGCGVWAVVQVVIKVVPTILRLMSKRKTER